MYQEEKIINGVLCYRTTPNGKWTQYTSKQLTERLMRFYFADGKYTIMHNVGIAEQKRIECANKLHDLAEENKSLSAELKSARDYIADIDL